MAQKKIRSANVRLFVMDGSYVKMAEMTGATISESLGAIDVTNDDSPGAKERLAGDGDWTISGDAFYVPDDSAMQAFRTALRTGSYVEVQVEEEDASGSKTTESGVGLVTSFERRKAHEQGYTYSITVQCADGNMLS